MEHNIETVLGDQYRMFFHPGLSVDRLTPVQTLKQCVNTVNDLINIHGRDFSQWNNSHLDILLQITRAHWIHQRLLIEPIRKPILVHKENNLLIVDCGDTRIMAVSALNNPPPVPTVITVKREQAKEYSNWIPIHNNLDLINLCGFDPVTSNVLFTVTHPPKDWCINWLEIGDRSTSHHLHDTNLAVTMLQRWLDTQPDNFQFSTEWMHCSIDWAKYQSS